MKRRVVILNRPFLLLNSLRFLHPANIPIVYLVYVSEYLSTRISAKENRGKFIFLPRNEFQLNRVPIVWIYKLLAIFHFYFVKCDSCIEVIITICSTNTSLLSLIHECYMLHPFNALRIHVCIGSDHNKTTFAAIYEIPSDRERNAEIAGWRRASISRCGTKRKNT